MLNISGNSMGSKDFLKSTLIHNTNTGRILAFIIIVVDAIFACIDIITYIIRVDKDFKYYNYLLMYVFMITINLLYLIFLNTNKIVKDNSHKSIKFTEFIMILYLTFVMSWGSVISLMDQKLYGQLIVFMINMISCSVFYILERRKLVIPYIISISILFIGLPFFQNSKNVLIGHYVNLIIFILISFTASRILYISFYNNFKSKELLKKSNLLLKKQIEQNDLINLKLADANKQLKKLSFIDELTGIPNRRSLNKYIYEMMEDKNRLPVNISIIMIDIDYFKQYNDYYGHNEGDKALKLVAKVISNVVINDSGYAARWGGEEFIYIKLNTNDEMVARIAETIRMNVHELMIQHTSSNDSYLSVSSGYSTMSVNTISDIQECIDLADKAMYYAKKSGRNCTKNTNDILPVGGIN